ncbi:ABC transporter permease [Bradyrhizobium sp.]|uniref:ABC transporter permease n=2 Tax=Bradyrhizobium sp. TaxID=376 RepID=UPI00262E5EE9|nr:ABC transporter permease [Bradyrhizobium sp.]
MADQPDLLVVQGEPLTLRPSGAWTLDNVETLEKLCARSLPAEVAKLDVSQVTALDTVGAWLIEKLSRRFSTSPAKVALAGVSASQAGLMQEMQDLNRRQPAARRRNSAALELLERVGRGVLAESASFLQMLGAVGIALLGVLRHPRSLRLTSTIYQLYKVGWLAIPIMALITFLIGAIIAQQGFFHFRKFGAESYTVDMVGILVLREIGVLIVAIMVAGRSGSAYTAELGSMKMREEIDALSTMGLDPVAVLILPRVAALVIALPILTFIGSMAGLYGGGLVAQFYGDMAPAIYIERLHEAVSVTSFKVGMLKAPFMALVIGIVACSEGLRVQGSAESLGKQTTTSVVKSIFLVIVLDGLFAIFFASIGM